MRRTGPAPAPRQVRKSGLHFARKFEVFTMSGGSIDDFHDGLEARIGRFVLHWLHSQVLVTLVIFTGPGPPRRPPGPRRSQPSQPASCCRNLVFVFQCSGGAFVR